MLDYPSPFEDNVIIIASLLETLVPIGRNFIGLTGGQLFTSLIICLRQQQMVRGPDYKMDILKPASLMLRASRELLPLLLVWCCSDEAQFTFCWSRQTVQSLTDQKSVYGRRIAVHSIWFLANPIRHTKKSFVAINSGLDTNCLCQISALTPRPFSLNVAISDLDFQNRWSPFVSEVCRFSKIT